MKYPHKRWNDNKGKHDRGQVGDPVRRNDRSSINDSQDSDSNYCEVNKNNRDLYNNISNSNFYSKEGEMTFSRNVKATFSPYDQTEKQGVEMRDKLADIRSSHMYNIDNRNVKHFEKDKTNKKYVNNNEHNKMNSYRRDTGNYKQSGENMTSNKYYNRHGNGKLKNVHEHVHKKSHAFNENSYGGRGSADGIYRSITGDNGSRKSSREFCGGGKSIHEQGRVYTDNINEQNEENHSAEFIELKRNLLKYMDTKEKNSCAEINEPMMNNDKENRRNSFEEHIEGCNPSLVNKRKLSYENQFSDASSIGEGNEKEIRTGEELSPDYNTYYHNIGSVAYKNYGTLDGTTQKDNDYSSKNFYNMTNRRSDNIVDCSRRRNIDNEAQINNSFNRNSNFSNTRPSGQKNMLDGENLHIKQNDNHINREPMTHFRYGEDMHSVMNLKNGDLSSDTLHNRNNSDLSEEDAFNETEKDLLQNNMSWQDEYLFGDNDNSFYNEIEENNEVDGWNQCSDNLSVEQVNYHQLSSEAKKGGNSEINSGDTMKYNSSILQNIYHPSMNTTQESYNSFNETLPTKEAYTSSYGVYDSLKGKKKEVRFALNYNDNMFPKAQIEESLRVLNTLQVDIEKICSYVKHFVDPPEPLFSTMRDVFLENEVSINSKIAIFYVYNHLIQELRHKYRNNFTTYTYISEIGLTNFVIPVLKYISERQKNKEIASKFYRCISIWNDRNIYSKFICDQLIALQKNPNRAIKMNPSNKTSLAHSAVSNEFSKCTPLHFLLRMPSVNNEHIEAKQNKVVHALMENMSKDSLKSFKTEAIEEAAKITDKAVRMFGQELILLNTEQMELSVLINDNHEEMKKLLNCMKNLDSVD